MTKKPTSKRKALYLILPIIAILTVVGIIFARKITPTPGNHPAQRFHIESDLYADQGAIIDITAVDFERMISDQKSFIVMAHMLICPAEAPLTTTIEEFTHNNNIVVYAMNEDEFENSSLYNTVKYLPTAAIYHDGQLVAWLDAESDEDLPAYKTSKAFKSWLGRYISLKP